MESDDRVSSVVGPAEQLRQLGLPQLLTDRGDFRRGLAERLVALFLLRNVDIEACFLKIRPVFLPRADDGLESGLFFEDDLGFVAVVPEIGLAGDLG